MSTTIMSGEGVAFMKDTLVKGVPSQIECIRVDGRVFALEGRGLRIARLEDEWYEDLPDPERAIAAFRTLGAGQPDLLTFWQRPPDCERRFEYHTEWEDLAVLEFDSYDQWWNGRIKSRVRNQIRKLEKEGIVLRESQYDDAFIAGMTGIFNESPVRQGRRFWHYGKSQETVRQQFAAYLHRETLVGAYLGDEMIAFMMLADAGRFALTGQILASLKHRDKALNNALVAKAVELCAARGVNRLVYYYWTDDSLAEFKRRCGFESMRVPRYYVPLSIKGKLGLGIGLHRGWKSMVPSGLRDRLKRARRAWNERRVDGAPTAPSASRS